MFRTLSFCSRTFKIVLAYCAIITDVYCANIDDCKETGIKVQLDKFNYGISNTNCTKGLLINDTIKLYGTITGIENDKVKDDDQVVIKKLNGGDIDVDTLKNCISGGNQTYICNFTFPTLNITYRELLQDTRNKIDVYLKVGYNNYFQCSETIELPAIFDPDKVKLFVNAQNVTESYQRITVDNSLLNLHCEDDIEPCDVYISQSTSKMKNTKEINYTIWYSICGRTDLNQYKKVTVILKTTDNDVCSLWNSLSIGLCVFLASLIVFLVVFIIVIIILKKQYPEWYKKYCCCLIIRAPPLNPPRQSQTPSGQGEHLLNHFVHENSDESQNKTTMT